ncbi:MAG: uroporphyrinogen-III decarboxylase [Chloroflexi bacterium]|nr:uroporphyrinogen-III decarboxylase [Chloroflexota bacterium]
MAREMDARERLDAVIRLELPDRVPVGGNFDAFCAVVAGITLEEWVFDPDKAEKAFHDSVALLGGYDVVQKGPPGGSISYEMAWPTKIKLPGRDIAPDTIWQLEEVEVMTVDDYDFIIREGFDAYKKVFWTRLGVVADAERIKLTEQRARESTDRLRAAGIEPILGGSMSLPLGFFSYARSLNCFMMDLYRCPEKLLAASDVMMESIMPKAIKSVEHSSSRRVNIPGTRGSVDFMSPRAFEKFFFPYLKQAVFALVEAEITPILHFDTNWAPLLARLLELPKGKCLLQLDGFTDIFQAKAVLGGHMALLGDVPPAMLSLGTPEEVTAYSRKLIEEVGKDGGFILAPGCTAPPDAKIENVRAMIDAAKEYGWYGRSPGLN